MVLKEKLQAALEAVATAREAALASVKSVNELSDCIEQSKQSILEIDAQRDKLKALKAESATTHAAAVEAESRLSKANAAVERLKALL